MAKALPPLNWFRAFESSARHLSFTGAAQEMGLTQSAISQQIRALEDRLGCALFERKNRGLTLTDHGRRLVPTVADALGTLRRATDSFAIGVSQDVLTVATSISIAQWFIVPRLTEFVAAHNAVAIRLMTKVWPDEFSNLSVDVEIRFDSLASARPNSKLLGRSEIGLFAAPELVGTIPDQGLALGDICSKRLIQVLGTADSWQDWALARGVTDMARPSLFADSYGMAVDLARSGAGIALASTTIAAPSVNDGSLVLVTPETIAASDGYHLSIDPSVTSDMPSKFADWLINQVAIQEGKLIRVANTQAT
tara:strand:+ start:179 stop:1105 length:927 start_codon:yes stop_codon:yes gene_type:complete